MWMVLFVIAASWGCPRPSQASHAGVRFDWHVDGDVLHGRLSAATSGWVAVGLNDRQSLGGSRLLMFAVENGAIMAEEHLADPPQHPRRELIGGAVDAYTSGDRLSVVFRVPLTRDWSPTLVPGDRVWLTLAWSSETDFAHHSAQRDARWITL